MHTYVHGVIAIDHTPGCCLYVLTLNFKTSNEPDSRSLAQKVKVRIGFLAWLEWFRLGFGMALLFLVYPVLYLVSYLFNQISS